MVCAQINRALLLAVICCPILMACANGSLEDHVPENNDEAEVLSLLIEYRNARQQFDLNRYLKCLHEDGIYHHASRVMVTKKELSALLPDFWQKLQKGDRLFFPMCRENLSGNYFVDFQPKNPRISINQDKARIVVTYVNKGWRLKHYISAIKEGNRWLINRLDWETG